jgi:hypothetical protein
MAGVLRWGTNDWVEAVSRSRARKATPWRGCGIILSRTAGEEGKEVRTMAAIKGVWRDGKIVLEHPADWPEGTEVKVEPVGRRETLGMREEDWPDTPEGIARQLALMDDMEGLVFTPEEEAEIAAWRQKIKEYTIANMNKRIEGLFE